MDEKCTWVRKGQTRTEKGIIVFGRAFKLLEKAHVELRSLDGHMGVLRRAHWWLRRARVD